MRSRGPTLALAAAVSLATPLAAQRPGEPPITALTAQSGGPVDAARDAQRIEALDLAIEVFPARFAIAATARLTIALSAPLDRLQLDLDRNLVVQAIRVDGAALPSRAWSNPQGRLAIALPRRRAAGDRVSVVIQYRGTPHVAVRAPWDDGFVWSRTPGGQPWIASTSQGYGCDLLWPCLDFPAGEPGVVDLHITVPRGLSAPANGVLTGITRHPDGRSTWNWRARTPNPYLIALSIGPYAELRASYQSRFGNRIPLHLWYLPERRAGAERLFAEFAPTLDFYETLIGPYPWGGEKLGVVETPHLGMEHQTINAYGNEYRPAPEGFDWLFHHELSHEWFGNQMTAADWDDFWLHEGFGQYMQPLYGRWREGEARYAAMMLQQRTQIRNRQPLISGRSRISGDVYQESRGGPGQDIYYKGSWVLHTLRNLIGDTAFFDATRRLVYGRPDPRPGNFSPRFATSAEFQALVAEVTGQDFGWFFDVYLRQAALPDLIETRAGDRLMLEWRAPAGLPFPMPVEVQVGDRIERVAMPGGRGSLTVPEGAHIVIDPFARILRRSAALEAVTAHRGDANSGD